MDLNSYHTYREITTQTRAWEQALETATAAGLPPAADYHQVLFTGCGSTYYLSLAAAAMFQELSGRIARAIPAGELYMSPQLVLAKGRTLLIAVSRSGTTTETVKAVEAFKRRADGDVLVISNTEEILTRLGDVVVVIPRGQEESIAQTRSFASMFVAAGAVCARMAGRTDLLDAMQALPAAGDRLIRSGEERARAVGADLDLDRFYFLGSGHRYGLACEANLKMKEMTLTHSEAFHFMEFRHGPMSMVGPGTLVAGMLSDANRNHEVKVLEEMRALGSGAWSFGDEGADVSFHSGIPELCRSVLYLPVLQLTAFHRSLAKGLNPDRPNNLSAVVELEL